MILLTLILLIQNSFAFSCLGNDKAEIRFKNTDELITNLYQPRLHTPLWTSQMAVNYLAYIVLTEKMGIDVSFYPYEEPGWINNWNIEAQRGCTEPEVECIKPTVELATGDAITIDCNLEEFETYCNCPEDLQDKCYPYPQYLYEWLKQDKSDFTYEYWTSHDTAVAADEYFYNPGFIDHNINNLLGEIGWYLPRYFTDEYPTAIVPNELTHNEEIKQQLTAGLNGSHGTINYIEYYSDINNLGDPYRWDLANRTWNGEQGVVILGSVEDYFQSEWSYQVAHNNNLTFITVGGEIQLNLLVTELYNARAPFIANIYIPDDNFARIDPVTGEFQKFEKIALPFNAAQSTLTQCFADFECGYPLEPLKKMKRPDLSDRFPELVTFWNLFGIDAEQLAIAIAYFAELQDANMTESEKWLNATCKWLLDERTEEVWTSWLVEIDRWDCINGCGIEYKNTGIFVGGECDYLTEDSNGDGTCNCMFDEIRGSNCDLSCPGLLGPFLDDNNDTYSFEYCSGNGICNIENLQCECEIGFGRENCGFKYPIHKLSDFLVYFTLVFGIMLMITIFTLSYLLRKRNNFDKIEITFSIGLIVLVLSTITLTFNNNYIDVGCISWAWSLGIGKTLAIFPFLYKSYIVNKIFKHNQIISNFMMDNSIFFKTLVKILLLDILIYSSYTMLYIFNGTHSTIYDDTNLRIEKNCNPNSNQVLLIYIFLYLYNISFLVILIYYAAKTRTAKIHFKEAICNFTISTLSFFCSIITLTFSFVFDDIVFRNLIQIITIYLIIFGIFFAFYFPKFNYIKEEDSEEDLELSSM